MRPANQQQAIRHMEHLLKPKLTGNRSTKVKERINRARHIAAVIWVRFQVGPYQYQLKHLRWYLDVHSKDLKMGTRYRYRLAIRSIIEALNDKGRWLKQLSGPWGSPTNTV